MPIGDLLAQITGAPSPSTDSKMSLPVKRKPEEQIRRPVDKAQKNGPSPVSSSSKPLHVQRPLAVDTRMADLKLATGSHRSSNTPKPADSSSKSNGPPTTNLTSSKAPPKKGSFREIMARAKVAQETLGPVGKISHKAIEKAPSKREREELRSQKSSNLQKNIGPNGKFRAAGQEIVTAVYRNGKTPTGDIKGKPIKKASAPVPEKKIKKAALATTGYTGTARPNPSGANGSSRTNGSGSASRYGVSDRYGDDRRGRGNSGARYAYVSEEDEGEEDEEPDYESESDMEAAAFEVDEEEEMATRIAKKEDAEALAEENRLKREKEEKKRRLAAMAKSRR